MISKNWVITSDIFSSLVTIFMLVISVTLYDKIKALDYMYLTDSAKNWSKGPLIDILQEQRFNICPPSYDPLISDYWPGTSEGYICEPKTSVNSTFSKTIIVQGEFYSQFMTNNCSKIDSVSSVRYKGWRSHALCGKRLDKNYLDLQIVGKYYYCPENHKKCGIVDSMNNILCVPMHLDCPINSIRFRKGEKGKEIAYGISKTNGKIPLEFKVSESTPCSDPNKDNSNYMDYALSTKFFASCNQSNIEEKAFDLRYSKIDSYSKKNLYKDNNILNTIKTLPEYPITTLSSKLGLYYRNYIGLNLACKEKRLKNGDTTETIINNLIYTEEILNSRGGVQLHRIISVFLCVILQILLITKFTMINIEGNKINLENKIFLNYGASLVSFFQLCNGVNMLIVIRSVIDNYYWLIEDDTCLDEFSSKNVEIFHKTMQSPQFLCGLFIFVALIGIFLPLNEFFIKKLNGDLLFTKPDTEKVEYEEIHSD